MRRMSVIAGALLLIVACGSQHENVGAVAQPLSATTGLVIIAAESAYESVGAEADILANGNFSAQARLLLNREGRYAFDAVGYEEIVFDDATWFATTDYGHLEEVSLSGRRGPVEIATTYVGSPDVFASSPFAYSDYDPSACAGEGGELIEIMARGDAASPILFSLMGEPLSGLLAAPPECLAPTSLPTELEIQADDTGLAASYVLVQPGTMGFQKISVIVNAGMPMEEISFHFIRITKSTPILAKAM